MSSLCDHVSSLLRWTTWANTRILETASSDPTAFADALPLFSHILAAEHIWLSRLSSEPPSLKVWPNWN